MNVPPELLKLKISKIGPRAWRAQSVWQQSGVMVIRLAPDRYWSDAIRFRRGYAPNPFNTRHLDWRIEVLAKGLHALGLISSQCLDAYVTAYHEEQAARKRESNLRDAECCAALCGMTLVPIGGRKEP